MKAQFQKIIVKPPDVHVHANGQSETSSLFISLAATVIGGIIVAAIVKKVFKRKT